MVCRPLILTFVHGNICDAELVVLLSGSNFNADSAAAVPLIDAIVHLPPNRITIIDSRRLPIPHERDRHVRVARRRPPPRYSISTTSAPTKCGGDLALDELRKFTELPPPYKPSSSYWRPRPPATTWCAPGTARTDSNHHQHCSTTTPLPSGVKFIPPITNILAGIRPKPTGKVWLRDPSAWEDHRRHLDDSHPRPYRGNPLPVGADGEYNIDTVLRMILKLMGRDVNDFDHVNDRPDGGDKAMPSTRLNFRPSWLGTKAPTSRKAWPRPSTGTARTKDADAG